MAIHPAAARHLARKILLLLVLVAATAAVVWWRDYHPLQESQPVTSTTRSSVSTNPDSFNKGQFSVNDPVSIWVVVNKGRLLPNTYVPTNLIIPKVALSEGSKSENMHLRQDASAEVEKLVAAATSEGLKLMLVSGYRSWATQQSVYNGYVAADGQAFADTTSARPGHSEHQTGLAADLGSVSRVCQLEACFGDTGR
ncbi:MAG: M15 family metallopeptidase [Patescibacteria group bacterium]